jgi:hypothetical protein
MTRIRKTKVKGGLETKDRTKKKGATNPQKYSYSTTNEPT